MPEHQGLHLGGPNLEPGCVDHALQPVCDEEVAVFVNPAQIARTKEALAFKLNEGFCRRLGLLPIARKHLRAVNDDFALLTLWHFEQGNRVNNP